MNIQKRMCEYKQDEKGKSYICRKMVKERNKNERRKKVNVKKRQEGYRKLRGKRRMETKKNEKKQR